ncbi:MAG: M20/M25/M40 family metallo-hydrolase, partial [Candidatus Omnitrophica bacterium]|nr:M20/M25/M40 family metallo-hydrolase [Candidatus Omnitrophota bacterium]
MNINQQQTEDSIKQPKEEFKSSFKTWIRAVAFIVIAVFLPEQAAQAMGYDPTTIWNHSYFVNQGKNGFLTYLVADNVQRSLNSLAYKQLNQVQLDKDLVIETMSIKKSDTIAKTPEQNGKNVNILQSGSEGILRFVTNVLKKISSPGAYSQGLIDFLNRGLTFVERFSYQPLSSSRAGLNLPYSDSNQGTASSQKPPLYITGSVVKQINLWLKDPKTQVDNNCGINALNALFVQSGIKITREELATRAIMVDFLSGNLRELKGELALSLFALNKTAVSFGLKTALVKIPIPSPLRGGQGRGIEALPLPFITYLLSEHFVLVTRVTDDKIYYKEDKEEANMPKEIFLKGFTGNCLILPSPLRGGIGRGEILPLSDQEALQISGKENNDSRLRSLKTAVGLAVGLVTKNPALGSTIANTNWTSTVSSIRSTVSNARNIYNSAVNVQNTIKQATGLSIGSFTSPLSNINIQSIKSTAGIATAVLTRNPQAGMAVTNTNWTKTISSGLSGIRNTLSEKATWAIDQTIFSSKMNTEKYWSADRIADAKASHYQFYDAQKQTAMFGGNVYNKDQWDEQWKTKENSFSSSTLTRGQEHGEALNALVIANPGGVISGTITGVLGYAGTALKYSRSLPTISQYLPSGVKNLVSNPAARVELSRAGALGDDALGTTRGLKGFFSDDTASLFPKFGKTVSQKPYKSISLGQKSINTGMHTSSISSGVLPHSTQVALRRIALDGGTTISKFKNGPWAKFKAFNEAITFKPMIKLGQFEARILKNTKLGQFAEAHPLLTSFASYYTLSTGYATLNTLAVDDTKNYNIHPLLALPNNILAAGGRQVLGFTPLRAKAKELDRTETFIVLKTLDQLGVVGAAPAYVFGVSKFYLGSPGLVANVLHPETFKEFGQIVGVIKEIARGNSDIMPASASEWGYLVGGLSGAGKGLNNMGRGLQNTAQARYTISGSGELTRFGKLVDFSGNTLSTTPKVLWFNAALSVGIPLLTSKGDWGALSQAVTNLTYNLDTVVSSSVAFNAAFNALSPISNAIGGSRFTKGLVGNIKANPKGAQLTGAGLMGTGAGMYYLGAHHDSLKSTLPGNIIANTGLLIFSAGSLYALGGRLSALNKQYVRLAKANPTNVNPIISELTRRQSLAKDLKSYWTGATLGVPGAGTGLYGIKKLAFDPLLGGKTYTVADDGSIYKATYAELSQPRLFSEPLKFIILEEEMTLDGKNKYLENLRVQVAEHSEAGEIAQTKGFRLLYRDEGGDLSKDTWGLFVGEASGFGALSVSKSLENGLEFKSGQIQPFNHAPAATVNLPLIGAMTVKGEWPYVLTTGALAMAAANVLRVSKKTYPNLPLSKDAGKEFLNNLKADLVANRPAGMNIAKAAQAGDLKPFLGLQAKTTLPGLAILGINNYTDLLPNSPEWKKALNIAGGALVGLGLAGGLGSRLLSPDKFSFIYSGIKTPLVNYGIGRTGFTLFAVIAPLSGVVEGTSWLFNKAVLPSAYTSFERAFFKSTFAAFWDDTKIQDKATGKWVDRSYVKYLGAQGLLAHFFRAYSSGLFGVDEDTAKLKVESMGDLFKQGPFSFLGAIEKQNVYFSAILGVGHRPITAWLSNIKRFDLGRKFRAAGTGLEESFGLGLTGLFIQPSKNIAVDGVKGVVNRVQSLLLKGTTEEVIIEQAIQVVTAPAFAILGAVTNPGIASFTSEIFQEVASPGGPGMQNSAKTDIWDRVNEDDPLSGVNLPKSADSRLSGVSLPKSADNKLKGYNIWGGDNVQFLRKLAVKVGVPGLVDYHSIRTAPEDEISILKALAMRVRNEFPSHDPDVWILRQARLTGITGCASNAQLLEPLIKAMGFDNVLWVRMAKPGERPHIALLTELSNNKYVIVDITPYAGKISYVSEPFSLEDSNLFEIDAATRTYKLKPGLNLDNPYLKEHQQFRVLPLTQEGKIAAVPLANMAGFHKNPDIQRAYSLITKMKDPLSEIVGDARVYPLTTNGKTIYVDNNIPANIIQNFYPSNGNGSDIILVSQNNDGQLINRVNIFGQKIVFINPKIDSLLFAWAMNLDGANFKSAVTSLIKLTEENYISNGHPTPNVPGLKELIIEVKNNGHVSPYENNKVLALASNLMGRGLFADNKPFDFNIGTVDLTKDLKLDGGSQVRGAQDLLNQAEESKKLAEECRSKGLEITAGLYEGAAEMFETAVSHLKNKDAYNALSYANSAKAKREGADAARIEEGKIGTEGLKRKVQAQMSAGLAEEYRKQAALSTEKGLTAAGEYYTKAADLYTEMAELITKGDLEGAGKLEKLAKAAAKEAAEQQNGGKGMADGGIVATVARLIVEHRIVLPVNEAITKVKELGYSEDIINKALKYLNAQKETVENMFALNEKLREEFNTLDLKDYAKLLEQHKQLQREINPGMENVRNIKVEAAILDNVMNLLANPIEQVALIAGKTENSVFNADELIKVSTTQASNTGYSISGKEEDALISLIADSLNKGRNYILLHNHPFGVDVENSSPDKEQMENFAAFISVIGNNKAPLSWLAAQRLDKEGNWEYIPFTIIDNGMPMLLEAVEKRFGKAISYYPGLVEQSANHLVAGKLSKLIIDKANQPAETDSGDQEPVRGQSPALPLPAGQSVPTGVNIVPVSGAAGSSTQALVNSNSPVLPTNDGGAKFIPIIKLKLNGILTSFTSGLAPPAALAKTFISNVSSVVSAVRSAVDSVEKLFGAQSFDSRNGERGQGVRSASSSNIGIGSIGTNGEAKYAETRGSIRASGFRNWIIKGLKKSPSKNLVIPALNQFNSKILRDGSWSSARAEVLAPKSTLNTNNYLRDGGNEEIGDIVKRIGNLVEKEIEELKNKRKKGETIAGRYPGEKNRGTRDAIIRKAEDNLRLMHKWGLNRSLTVDEVGLDLDDDFNAKMTIYGAISGVNGSRGKLGDKQLIMELDKIIETIKHLSDEDKVELMLEVLKGMPLLESAKIIKPLEAHLKEGYLMRLPPEDREKLERILGEHRDYSGNEQILKMLEEIKAKVDRNEARLDKTEEKVEEVKQEAGAAKQEAVRARETAVAADLKAGKRVKLATAALESMGIKNCATTTDDVRIRFQLEEERDMRGGKWTAPEFLAIRNRLAAEYNATHEDKVELQFAAQVTADRFVGLFKSGVAVRVIEKLDNGNLHVVLPLDVEIDEDTGRISIKAVNGNIAGKDSEREIDPNDLDFTNSGIIILVQGKDSNRIAENELLSEERLESLTEGRNLSGNSDSGAQGGSAGGAGAGGAGGGGKGDDGENRASGSKGSDGGLLNQLEANGFIRDLMGILIENILVVPSFDQGTSKSRAPPAAKFADLANTFRNLANQLSDVELNNLLNNSASALENLFGLMDKAVRRDEDDVIAALLKKLMGSIKTRGLKDLHGRYFRAARLIAHRYGLPYSSTVELAAAFMLLNETDAFIQALKEEAYVRAEALKAKEGETEGTVAADKVVAYDLLNKVFVTLNNSAARYASDGGLAINAIRIWLGEVREGIRSIVDMAASVFRAISGLLLRFAQRRGNNNGALLDSNGFPSGNNRESVFSRDGGERQESAFPRLLAIIIELLTSVLNTFRLPQTKDGGMIAKLEGAKDVDSQRVVNTNKLVSTIMVIIGAASIITSQAPPVNGLIARLVNAINLATGGQDVNNYKNSRDEGTDGGTGKPVPNPEITGIQTSGSSGDVESEKHSDRKYKQLISRLYTELNNLAKLGARLVRGLSTQLANAHQTDGGAREPLAGLVEVLRVKDLLATIKARAQNGKNLNGRVYVGGVCRDNIEQRPLPKLRLLLKQLTKFLTFYQSPSLSESGRISKPIINEPNKPITIKTLIRIVNLIKSAATNAASRTLEKSSKVWERALSLLLERNIITIFLSYINNSVNTINLGTKKRQGQETVKYQACDGGAFSRLGSFPVGLPFTRSTTLPVGLPVSLPVPQDGGKNTNLTKLAAQEFSLGRGLIASVRRIRGGISKSEVKEAKSLPIDQTNIKKSIFSLAPPVVKSLIARLVNAINQLESATGGKNVKPDQNSRNERTDGGTRKSVPNPKIAGIQDGGSIRNAESKELDRKYEQLINRLYIELKNLANLGVYSGLSPPAQFANALIAAPVFGLPALAHQTAINSILITLTQPQAILSLTGIAFAAIIISTLTVNSKERGASCPLSSSKASGSTTSLTLQKITQPLPQPVNTVVTRLGSSWLKIQAQSMRIPDRQKHGRRSSGLSPPPSGIPSAKPDNMSPFTKSIQPTLQTKAGSYATTSIVAAQPASAVSSAQADGGISTWVKNHSYFVTVELLLAALFGLSFLVDSGSIFYSSGLFLHQLAETWLNSGNPLPSLNEYFALTTLFLITFNALARNFSYVDSGKKRIILAAFTSFTLFGAPLISLAIMGLGGYLWLISIPYITEFFAVLAGAGIVLAPRLIKLPKIVRHEKIEASVEKEPVIVQPVKEESAAPAPIKEEIKAPKVEVPEERPELKQELIELDKQKQALREEIQQLQAQRDELKKSVLETQNQANEIIHKAKEIEEQAKVQAQISQETLTEEQRKLQEQFEAKKQEVATQIADLEEKLGQAKARHEFDLAEIEQKKIAAQKELTGLISEIDKTKTERDGINAAIAALSQKYDSLLQELLDLDTQEKALQSSIKNLKQEEGRLKLEVSELKKKTEEIGPKVEKIKEVGKVVTAIEDRGWDLVSQEIKGQHADVNRLVHTLRKYLYTPSRTGEEDLMRDVLEQEIRDIFEDENVRIVKPEGRHKNLICEIAASNQELAQLKPIIVNAHMDAYSHYFSEINIEERAIYNQEVDDSVGLAVIIEAMRILKDMPHRKIYVVFDAAEEAGMLGMISLLQDKTIRQEFSNAEFAVTIDGPIDWEGIGPASSKDRKEFEKNPHTPYVVVYPESVPRKFNDFIASCVSSSRHSMRISHSGGGSEGILARELKIPVANLRAAHTGYHMPGKEKDMNVKVENLVALADWFIEILLQSDSELKTHSVKDGGVLEKIEKADIITKAKVLNTLFEESKEKVENRLNQIRQGIFETTEEVFHRVLRKGAEKMQEQFSGEPPEAPLAEPLKMDLKNALKDKKDAKKTAVDTLDYMEGSMEGTDKTVFEQYKKAIDEIIKNILSNPQLIIDVKTLNSEYSKELEKAFEKIIEEQQKYMKYSCSQEAKNEEELAIDPNINRNHPFLPRHLKALLSKNPELQNEPEVKEKLDKTKKRMMSAPSLFDEVAQYAGATFVNSVPFNPDAAVRLMRTLITEEIGKNEKLRGEIEDILKGPEDFGKGERQLAGAALKVNEIQRLKQELETSEKGLENDYQKIKAELKELEGFSQEAKMKGQEAAATALESPIKELKRKIEYIEKEIKRLKEEKNKLNEGVGINKDGGVKEVVKWAGIGWLIATLSFSAIFAFEEYISGRPVAYDSYSLLLASISFAAIPGLIYGALIGKFFKTRTGRAGGIIGLVSGLIVLIGGLILWRVDESIAVPAIVIGLFVLPIFAAVLSFRNTIIKILSALKMAGMGWLVVFLSIYIPAKFSIYIFGIHLSSGQDDLFLVPIFLAMIPGLISGVLIGKLSKTGIGKIGGFIGLVVGIAVFTFLATMGMLKEDLSGFIVLFVLPIIGAISGAFLGNKISKEIKEKEKASSFSFWGLRKEISRLREDERFAYGEDTDWGDLVVEKIGGALGVYYASHILLVGFLGTAAMVALLMWVLGIPPGKYDYFSNVETWHWVLAFFLPSIIVYGVLAILWVGCKTINTIGNTLLLINRSLSYSLDYVRIKAVCEKQENKISDSLIKKTAKPFSKLSKERLTLIFNNWMNLEQEGKVVRLLKEKQPWPLELNGNYQAMIELKYVKKDISSKFAQTKEARINLIQIMEELESILLQEKITPQMLTNLFRQIEQVSNNSEEFKLNLQYFEDSISKFGSKGIEGQYIFNSIIPAVYQLSINLKGIRYWLRIIEDLEKEALFIFVKNINIVTAYLKEKDTKDRDWEGLSIVLNKYVESYGAILSLSSDLLEEFTNPKVDIAIRLKRGRVGFIKQKLTQLGIPGNLINIRDPISWEDLINIVGEEGIKSKTIISAIKVAMGKMGEEGIYTYFNKEKPGYYQRFQRETSKLNPEFEQPGEKFTVCYKENIDFIGIEQKELKTIMPIIDNIEAIQDIIKDIKKLNKGKFYTKLYNPIKTMIGKIEGNLEENIDKENIKIMAKVILDEIKEYPIENKEITILKLIEIYFFEETKSIREEIAISNGSAERYWNKLRNLIKEEKLFDLSSKFYQKASSILTERSKIFNEITISQKGKEEGILHFVLSARTVVDFFKGYISQDCLKDHETYSPKAIGWVMDPAIPNYKIIENRKWIGNLYAVICKDKEDKVILWIDSVQFKMEHALVTNKESKEREVFVKNLVEELRIYAGREGFNYLMIAPDSSSRDSIRAEIKKEAQRQRANSQEELDEIELTKIVGIEHFKDAEIDIEWIQGLGDLDSNYHKVKGYKLNVIIPVITKEKLIENKLKIQTIAVELQKLNNELKGLQKETEGIDVELTEAKDAQQITKLQLDELNNANQTAKDKGYNVVIEVLKEAIKKKEDEAKEANSKLKEIEVKKERYLNNLSNLNKEIENRNKELSTIQKETMQLSSNLSSANGGESDGGVRNNQFTEYDSRKTGILNHLYTGIVNNPAKLGARLVRAPPAQFVIVLIAAVVFGLPALTHQPVINFIPITLIALKSWGRFYFSGIRLEKNRTVPSFSILTLTATLKGGASCPLSSSKASGSTTSLIPQKIIQPLLQLVNTVVTRLESSWLKIQALSMPIPARQIHGKSLSVRSPT